MTGRSTSPETGRQILAVPWSSEHVHVAGTYQLVADMAQAAQHPGPERIVPVLLDYARLEKLVHPQSGVAPIPLLDLITQEVAAAAGRSEEDAVRWRSLIADHLVAGRLCPVLMGLADLDASEHFLSEQQATEVLNEIAGLRIRTVVLVARGSGGPGTPPTVARQALLNEYGLTNIQWAAGHEPTSHVHPLLEHLEWVLADPNGPAWSQVLPLQAIGQTLLDTVGRDTASRQYLLPDEARHASENAPVTIIPRLPRRFVSLPPSPPATITDEAALNEYLRMPAGPGLVLIDQPSPGGGHGKTVQTLALAAAAERSGRSVLWLRVPDLVAQLGWRQHIPRTSSTARAPLACGQCRLTSGDRGHGDRVPRRRRAVRGSRDAGDPRWSE